MLVFRPDLLTALTYEVTGKYVYNSGANDFGKLDSGGTVLGDTSYRASRKQLMAVSGGIRPAQIDIIVTGRAVTKTQYLHNTCREVFTVAACRGCFCDTKDEIRQSISSVR